jgi:predicted SnoaL-like aldol condensation-catalyzing enzyme
MKPTLLILFSLLLPAAAHATVPTTKEERNKAIALRVFEEIFNQGKFSVADKIYAPDFKNHGLNPEGQWVGADLKTDQNAVHDEKKAFPDLKMTVNNMVAEGDLVAVH